MEIERMHYMESDAVSQLVANAFFDKFSGRTTLSKGVLQKIVKILWLEEAENFGMSVFTVKSDEEIVGAFGVTKRNRVRPTLKLLAKAAAVVKMIGVKEFLSFVKVGLETNRKLSNGEWYIDFIVVKEGFRNQNIGHTIMSELDKMIVEDSKASELSLYVLEGNARARHLYEKYGFIEKPDSKKEFYHLMVKKRLNQN